MKILIKLDLDNAGILEILKELANDQLWHINDTIQRLHRSEDRPAYMLKDLNDFFDMLGAINKLIVYYGGEKVEVFCANVVPGFDLDGKPF